ncbi:MAG: hypothetical protein RL198_760 [Actinomycetota bacterium]
MPKTDLKTLRRARFSVSAYFLIGGSALALWAVNIPLIQRQVGISYAELGLLLMLAGVGGFTALQLSGWLIDRIGSKTATLVGGVAVGVALIAPGLAQDSLQLGAAIFLLGFGLAAVDVPMNAAALEVEEEYGRTIFSAFHAFWSVGGLVGAILGGALIWLGWLPDVSLPISGLALALCGVLLSAWLLPNPESKPKPARDERKQTSILNRRVYGLIALASFMAAAGAIIEGTANDWSALYLRDVIGRDEAFAALGLAAFSVGMIVGRLRVDRLVDLFGRSWVLRWGGIGSTVATLLLIVAPPDWLALLGWALLGIAMSGVVPQVFAVAGRIGETGHHGRNLAKVVGITYLGALAGPSVIGLLTVFLPLNLALGFGAVLAMLIVLFTPKLARLS